MDSSSSASHPQRCSPGRTLLRGVLIFIGIPYLVVTLLFVALQRQLLYPATRTNAIPTPPGAASTIHDVTVQTFDGLVLHGWWLVRDAGNELADDPQPQNEVADALNRSERGLVLCFPGNSGNRQVRHAELGELARANADVLMFDYRGYGDNPGSPTEAAINRDAQAIWMLACHELGYETSRIILFGESLGGAVAVQLAADASRQGSPPAALVVSSSFDSLPSVVAGHYPAFPFRWLLLDTWRSDSRIGKVTCPIVIMHGTADDLIPIRHARMLHANAPQWSQTGVPKQFVELTGNGHNDVPSMRLRQIIEEFLRDVAAPA
ncbi:MAG: alpha/beta hydrolase [Planctomycetaceae bacterium]|nr:alpha/beta hydrolase [Planctomycetaceae bacterium]